HMLQKLLDQLDELKNLFSKRADKTVQAALARLSQLKFSNVAALTRYHEILLFLRAYPYSAATLRLVEREITNFSKRVEALRELDADLSPLEVPEVSGIAGTSVTDTFSYYIVRWLLKARTEQGRVGLDWDWFEDENRLAETWPRFIPLLEKDSQVEANVPYRKWLCSAAAPSGERGSAGELTWLIERFESLSRTEKEKAELYDSQKLYVRWRPAYRATRTGMRLRTTKIFYHRGPLIKRRDVSLLRELESPPTILKQLSPKRGAEILDMTRAASTVRYRELYGFTHGDAKKVFQTNLGRGVDVFVVALPPGKRLPLCAYHAAMIFKNGVPVGYFEGISLFERMESGFNLYYTFRDGETAWLYARILNIFRHLLGVTVFSLDPYQIGYENEEGIESGAFWFYRKLGFRPTSPEVMKRVLNEEKKIATRAGYRTTARTLRKLAESPMIFELDKAPGKSTAGEWDRFCVRNLGLAVARRMGSKFGGDVERFREAAVKKLNGILGLSLADWQEIELPALSDFAIMLALVPDLHRWSDNEKQALAHVIRAKAASDERRYLQLMQKHTRLRSTMIRLGS
ncbi:MAG TPA: hypothetical protein VGJ66_15370, partial [Pyrinomonadaceae bacterium]